LAAAIDLLFIVAASALLAVAVTRGPELLVIGAPGVLYAVLSLPLAAMALTVAAIAGLTRVWRHGRWTLRHRLRVSRLLIPLVAFLPFLHFWNLLGFRL
jgi:hypothetical protein